MSTHSKAYVTKFSSGTILALLAFSGLLFMIPIATPIFAANASLPGVTATGNNPALGGVSQAFTLTVSNPASNQYTVTAFTINAPSGWTITACTPGGFLSANPCSFTATGVTWSVSQFTVGTGAGIPPGSSDTLVFQATAATGTYPFSSTFTSKVQDASSVAFYTGPSFSILVIDHTTVINSVTPAMATNYIAGSAAFTETATLNLPEAGVPIVFTAPGYALGFTGFSFTPATATTNSAGVATTVFQPSNLDCGNQPTECDTTIQANIGTSSVAPTASAAITTLAGAPTAVTWTLAPVASNGDHYITTEHTTLNQGGVVAAVTGAYMVNTGASFSIADKFGNAVEFGAAGLTYTVSITALSGGGLFDALGLPSVISCTSGGANWKSGSTNIAGGACPGGAATSASLPFNYFQSATYNAIGELSAGVSGMLSGSAFAGAGQSGQLITSAFTGASPAPVQVYPPTGASTLPDVPAGDQVNVTATLAPPASCTATEAAACPAQAGVPVNLMLDQKDSFETAPLAADYGAGSMLTVGFSNGLTYTTATTNAAGQASGLFTIDTVAGANAFFRDNVTQPTDASITHTWANATAGAAVVTVANLPVTFTVLPYYATGAGCAPASLCDPATHAATGASLYLDVTISDAYGNIATNTGLSNIQITLAASCAASCPLSATTAYIESGQSDTFPTFGAIVWTMPATAGSVTITASGVLSGHQKTSSPVSIGVVSPDPTLAIISPKNTGTIYSSSNAVVFTGQANVSVGYASVGPEAVTIASVTYKIDSGSVQTAPITLGYSITFSVAASFTAGLHHITFNATDSLGNSVTGATYTVLVDTSTPAVAFTTKTGASVGAGKAVNATITVAEGDLNATSVVATLNGTAIASANVIVTGTNNLGSSVTYTVMITGLTAGHDVLGLSASSLAGHTGTATAITITVTVPFSLSVVINSATYGTLGSFNGVAVGATNVWSTSQSLVVFAVWKNSAGQTVAVTTGGLSLAAGATGTTFAPLPSALPSGSYTVNVFVITTGNSPVSSTTSITASQ
jgi:hypothetical protein